MEYDKNGVKVNASCRRETQDLCGGRYLFALQIYPRGRAMAQIVIQNACFPPPFGLGLCERSVVIRPWCTFTERNGACRMYEKDAKEKGIKVETYTYKLTRSIARSSTGDEASRGFT